MGRRQRDKDKEGGQQVLLEEKDHSHSPNLPYSKRLGLAPMTKAGNEEAKKQRKTTAREEIEQEKHKTMEEATEVLIEKRWVRRTK